MGFHAKGPPLELPRWQVAILAAATLATFAPALNNHFIADDYVFLEDVENFKTNVFFLFNQPPLNFRMTTFLVFFLLKSIWGYTPAVFYAFSIAVHFINCLLLWTLLRLFGRANSEAFTASILFAVFHAPQEAVVWAAAIGEMLQGLCFLAILILWLKERYAPALVCYIIALFTKESAPLALILVGLADWHWKRSLLRLPVVLFVVLTVAFGCFFLWMWTSNTFIQGGAYAFGPKALPVLILSIHRLLWPWIYPPVIALRISARRWITVSGLVRFLGLLALAMSPYIFLTYARALPSRHLYLASMVFCAATAYLVGQLPGGAFRKVFIVVFAGFNIGVFWIRKDADFERRARPTMELVNALAMRKPEPTLILNFPYPYPEIAKATAAAAAGWNRNLIRVDGTEESCAGCAKLRWDAQSQRYESER